jgi:hypothetical protein
MVSAVWQAHVRHKCVYGVTNSARPSALLIKDEREGEWRVTVLPLYNHRHIVYQAIWLKDTLIPKTALQARSMQAGSPHRLAQCFTVKFTVVFSPPGPGPGPAQCRLPSQRRTGQQG